MKRIAWLFPALAFAACGGTGATGGFGAGTSTGGSSSSGTTSSASVTTSSSTGTGGTTTSACGAGCPSGYTCRTANAIPVCRASSGVPLFSNVFLVVMENTSLSTLSAAMKATPSQAPNLQKMATTYASGGNYWGVAHPSLPNYIALTSGDTQSIVCDCDAKVGEGTCSSNALACEAALLVSKCSCPVNAMNIADQLEAANKTWMAWGEDMGTPCNTTDSGNYAQRHVPFLYYNDIQTNAARCNAHVVDFSNFSPASPAAYNFITPNLVDDMHNPDPTNSTNIPSGDAWIGPLVDKITVSAAYKAGGLLVVVWDEDDGSGGILLNNNAPSPIFVMSPYARSGGYQSAVMANHYSLLATIEDGLDLPRLGNASKPGTGYAETLSDYFPAN